MWCKLEVLWHNGEPLGQDGRQSGVLKKIHQSGLGSLLQRHDSQALGTQVGVEVPRDLAHQPLERQFMDQQLGGLLVVPDLSRSTTVPAG